MSGAGTNNSKATFQRQISLGNLLQILAMLGAIFVFALRYESRLTATEEQIEKIDQTTLALRADMNAAIDSLTSTMATMAKTIEQNRQFQIDQRVRQWDALRGLETKLNNLSERMAATTAILERVEAGVEKINDRSRNFEK